jgi:prephenate dehydrogenase
MKTVGIIGFGSFGQFMAKHIKPFANITVYDVSMDVNSNSDVTFGTLADVLNCEIVILGVPVQVLENVLIQIKEFIRPGTIFLDVCSVKVKPIDLMLKHLPKDVDIIGTHPLFGPKSGAKGISGLKIAICNTRCSSENFEMIKNFLSEKLDLAVLGRTPEEHDKEVAYAQVLTHFIARALKDMNIPKLDQTTKTYDKLMDVMDIISLDSMELFMAIQKENPYAADVRKDFLDSLSNLDDLANE